MVSWVDIMPTLIEMAGGTAPQDIDGNSFAKVLSRKSDSHRDKIFTTHTGDGVMNIFPMRSVRVGDWKYIHNLCPDAYHSNHTDRLRRDGGGAYWNSWDTQAKTDKQAAAKIERYYTRPEFELFNLDTDPSEQNNLAYQTKQAQKLKELQLILKAWTESQGDDLKPHREPYSRSKRMPLISSSKKPSKPKRSK